jgi:hypothetical protein
MKATRPILSAAAVLLATAPLALGQGAPPAANLSGSWNLQCTFELPVDPMLATGPDALDGGPTCDYEGTAHVIQDGEGGVTGSASVALVAGDPPCPAEMSGSLTGSLVGTTLTGKLTDPNLGESDFTGSLTPALAARQGAIAAGAQAGLMLAGTNMVVGQSPFAGATGTFMAVARASVVEIPTLGAAGLVALVLLLAASAAFLLLRRRTA